METLFVGKAFPHSDRSHQPQITPTPEVDNSSSTFMVSKTFGVMIMILNTSKERRMSMSMPSLGFQARNSML